MNNRTRKEIDKIIQRIYSLQADIKSVGTSGDDNEDMIEELNELADEANDIQNDIQYLADDERDKFDNLTEGLQCSDRGMALEEAADALDDAANIDDSQIQAIIEALENDEDPDWDVDFSEFVDSLEQAQSV